MIRFCHLRITALLCCFLLLSPVLSLAEQLSAGILEISKYGNVVLTVTGSEFLSGGFDYGDVVTVSFGDHSHDMPVGSSYSDVDDGCMICRVEINETEDRLVLAINMGDFAAENGIAVKTAIDAEPGYRWDMLGTDEEPFHFSFSMKEKGGYAGEYSLRQLVRSNERADYPHLTDEQFANFREVRMGGMGEGVLYRSSSPIDPQLGRNAYADAALEAAGVCTVINLADAASVMQSYPGYGESAYAKCSVIALNLGLDVRSETFEAGFAQGLRFMTAHEAPYLVHCTEGKDRGGFVSAVLACLMGGSAQEVMADYMITYENYYGMQKDSESYRIIAENNMKKTLEAVFEVEDIAAPGINLADEAQEYLTERLGLTEDEVNRLKVLLSGQ